LLFTSGFGNDTGLKGDDNGEGFAGGIGLTFIGLTFNGIMFVDDNKIDD
jgi:hypothetical protein